MNREEILKWDKQEFDKISDGLNKLNGKNELSYLEFLRIRNFKIQNSSRATEKYIQNITKEAFIDAGTNEKNEKIERAILTLKKLLGVGIPIASTILAMKYPDRYCIIDRNVIKELCKEKIITEINEKKWLKDYTYNPPIYREYLILMRKKAKENNKELRTFERELFERKWRKKK